MYARPVRPILCDGIRASRYHAVHTERILPNPRPPSPRRPPPLGPNTNVAHTSSPSQPCLRVYKLGTALGIFLLGQNWFFQPLPEPPGFHLQPIHSGAIPSTYGRRETRVCTARPGRRHSRWPRRACIDGARNALNSEIYGAAATTR